MIVDELDHYIADSDTYLRMQPVLGDGRYGYRQQRRQDAAEKRQHIQYRAQDTQENGIRYTQQQQRKGIQRGDDQPFDQQSTHILLYRPADPLQHGPYLLLVLLRKDLIDEIQ